MSTEKKPDEKPAETVGEQAWNTVRALILATLICLVAIVAVMAWAANRPVDHTDWSKFETSTTAPR